MICTNRTMRRSGTNYSLFLTFFISLFVSCFWGDELPAPSDLRATATFPVQITLDWQDNSSNEESFEIERRTIGGNFKEIAIVLDNITSYSDLDLNPRSTYEYRVRAVNDAQNSNYSNIASATTGDPLPPLHAPTDLTAIANSSSRIKLAWRDNSENEESFEIERSPDGNMFSEIAIVLENITTFTDTALSPNTTYYYRVRAVNDFENSEYSNVASATSRP